MSYGLVSRWPVNLLLVGALVCSGCATEGKFAYGNLHSLRNALDYSSRHCDDPAARALAARWAAIGAEDLHQSLQYMRNDTPEYEETRALQNVLTAISYRRVKPKDLCFNAAIAVKGTDALLKRLNNPSPQVASTH